MATKSKSKSKLNSKAKQLVKRKVVGRKVKKSYESYHLPVRAESEQMRDMNEDLREAWLKLRAFARSLGEHKFHTSAKAMMFTCRLCYMFVRPKKAYLEVTFFSAEELKHPQIAKATRVSKSRVANIFRLVHADQVEEPLTSWIRDARELGV
jgi:hypothetical protein